MTSFGYVPLHPSMAPPGDRRRFPGYAEGRSLDFSVIKGWDDVDVAVLSTEADIFRWCRAPVDVAVVLDLPDAFLDEVSSAKTRARGLAKWVAGPLSRPVMDYDRAMRRLIVRADAVVCSTPEQAEKLKRHSDNVHVALDLHVEIEPLSVREDTVGGAQFSRLDVVWEGMHPTLGAIEQVLPALRMVDQMRGVTFHLITDPAAPRFMNRFLMRNLHEVVSSWGLTVEIHDWEVGALRDVAQNCDVAIVPVVREDPYQLGKPENRMRIFWRLGLPVIASDTPAHRRAVDFAGVPLDTLCVGQEEWETTLVSYAADGVGRRLAAEKGQAAALGPYGDETILGAWDQVFASVGVR